MGPLCQEPPRLHTTLATSVLAHLFRALLKVGVTALFGVKRGESGGLENFAALDAFDAL